LFKRYGETKNAEHKLRADSFPDTSGRKTIDRCQPLLQGGRGASLYYGNYYNTGKRVCQYFFEKFFAFSKKLAKKKSTTCLFMRVVISSD